MDAEMLHGDDTADADREVLELAKLVSPVIEVCIFVFAFAVLH